jgi:predicted trehalose synthase
MQEYQKSQKEVMDAFRESHNALGNTLAHIHLALEALACPDTTDEDGDGEN